jgi:hypothetical protein
VPPTTIARVPGLVAAGVALVLLTGCTAPGPDPGPTAPPEPAPVESATPEPEPDPVVLMPDGSAGDNLPFFAQIVRGVWAGPDARSGRAYIDALVGAGFDKAAMEVTQDESTVGNPAESLQFSIRWGEGECLVGQVGPATGDPVATVLPRLPTGSCLLGQTRAIDW